MITDELLKRIEKMQSNPYYKEAFPELEWSEKASINAYTDEEPERLSSYLNKYLRGANIFDKSKTAKLQMYSNFISQGLLKANSKFKKLSYRGVALTENQIDQYRKAQENDTVIQVPGFSSSSAEPAIARTFSGLGVHEGYGDVRVVFIIRGNKGVEITPISAYPTESEILFNKQMEIKVLDVDVENGITYIDVEEV